MNNQTNQRRGEYLLDNSETGRYDINNCRSSLTVLISIVMQVSGCEQEEQIKRSLNSCCSSIISLNDNSIIGEGEDYAATRIHTIFPLTQLLVMQMRAGLSGNVLHTL